MKKIISISLVFVFLISTLGLSLVVNYCPMKQGYSLSFKEHKSCCCDDSNENDCCKSVKYSFNKIEDQYVASSCHFNTAQFEFISQGAELSIIFFGNSFARDKRFYKNLWPPKIPVSLNILYCSILI